MLRVMTFVLDTKQNCLILQPKDEGTESYCDIDWAGDAEMRISGGKCSMFHPVLLWFCRFVGDQKARKV
jgi:hypothetical protein